MSTRYIYTEKNDCQDCYKCIRECPVKAIKVEDQSASVVHELCIYCGHCTQVCPVEAKKVREDISKVKFFLQQGKSVFVSLAPAFRAEFAGISDSQLIIALKKLGFTGVSETALGAEMISSYTQELLSNAENGVYLSSCCPSAVEQIGKYYPQHKDKLLQVDTPMLAHGKYLREYYGDQIKVVFIGPCIAKKKEAEENEGSIDAVITFRRLREWFAEEGVSFEEILPSPSQEFMPFGARKGRHFPLEGGMIECMNGAGSSAEISYLSFSGVNRTTPILRDLDKIKTNKKLFLELMACSGGCINGPGMACEDSLVSKTVSLQDSGLKGNVVSRDSIQSDLANTYDYLKPLPVKDFTESQIKDTLLAFGKRYHKDELNCGGCGYESCRDFAKAILADKAERKMCVSYMRRVAQDKATVLLQRMPYGVVIVDKQLQVIESNRNFAQLVSPELAAKYDAQEGLENEDLRQLIPYAHYFENMMESGVQSMERDIKQDGRLLHLSIFSLQGNHMFCAILRNLSTPELKREEIVKRSRKVVRENLKTVQKIAFYLGENASNMETLLNSIVDIQNDNDEA